MYQRCSNFTNVAKEANTTSDKLDAEIRDLSKKVPNNWENSVILTNSNLTNMVKEANTSDKLNAEIRDLSKKIADSLPTVC